MKSINRNLMLAIFIIFVLSMIILTYYINTYYIGHDKYFTAYNVTYNNKLANIISNQKATDKEINDISNSDKYTIDNPYVLVNPYGISPLSALIIFTTNNESSVTLSINDTYKTTISKAKRHIIPVYTFYANSTNYVNIALEDGTNKTIEIKTEAFDDATNINNFKKIINKEDEYLLLDKTTNKLRGFDYNGNLVYNLDLDNIYGLTFNNEYLFINYNNIGLEMDYLGRIIGINNDISLITTEANISDNYIGSKMAYSHELISNFQTKTIMDNKELDKYNKLMVSDIEDKLDTAIFYEKKFKFTLLNNYIDLDINEDEYDLILVPRKGKDYYMYHIKGNNRIKVDIKEDVSVFMILDNKYYSLQSTLKFK